MNEAEHLLTVLGEECAEIQQRISKALRFGLSEVEPGQATNNHDRICVEIADFRGVLELLQEREILRAIPYQAFTARIEAKKVKVQRFMEYAREQGTLERK